MFKNHLPFLLFVFVIAIGACFADSEVPEGRWYGDDVYFGYEYDMHANKNDKRFGSALTVDYLVELFKLTNCDLLQTDTKGHEGLVSWKSKTPTASIAPGLEKEMVDYWVKAGKQLGLPCQAHYSGIFDMAAGDKFPEWNAVDAKGEYIKGKMCPRGPYADRLLIPQAKELVSRYGVSAMWVDGEIWAVVPCYCSRCTKAFKDEYKMDPPTSQEDENWMTWIGFTRQSFQEYVAHYVDAIHEFSPETFVCSNWLHSFRNPGRPWVPTDYISGDNLGTLSHPNNDCQARFMSTRGRPWEIVLWGFYYNKNAPWIMKPVEMMKQQAATIIALGGNINIYNQPKGHRDGRLCEWHMKRLGQVGTFVKKRKEYCQHSEMIPNAVVLHSEYDFYAQKSPNIWEYNVSHLEGALACLLDNSIPTDILDEWALLEPDRLNQFKLVMAPSQDKMSKKAVEVLKQYVQRGGRLLLTGPDVLDTFGEDFLGVKDVGVKSNHTYHIPALDGRFPLSSAGHQGGAWTAVDLVPWREVQPVSAKGISPATTTLFEEDSTAYFGATVHKVGLGKVAYIPFDITTYYYKSRYPMVRAFVKDVIDELDPDFDYEISAPSAVEVIIRKKGDARLVHFVNRASGLRTFDNTLGTDEIPMVGPISVKVQLPKKPECVELLFEDMPCTVKCSKQNSSVVLEVSVQAVRLHSALIID